MRLGINDKKTLTAVICLCTAFILIFCAVIAIVIFAGGKDTEPKDEPKEEKQEINISGVWIASVSNIDFPSKPDLSEEELKAELDDIVKTTKTAGLDTIFFQVRPSGDALYKSEIFPVSRYLSTSGKLELDCLDYIIKAAHSEDIKVHAWVNPLRGATPGTADKLSDEHPVKAHPSWAVQYADGAVYFDCGRQEVVDLICDGVEEIVKDYDVDGIVFDDYFYPYPKNITNEDGTTVAAVFDDEDTFAQYGKAFDTLADWRRSNVNRMVESVYKTVKKADKNCIFGISPFGIWKNGYGDESGSETKGLESYSAIYCDTLAWVEGGYVDYVAPQLYWTNDTAAAPYDVLCRWWGDMLEDTDVKLVVSHGAYRYENDWESPMGIMTSQVELAKGEPSYGGSVFYGYSEIKNNTNKITDEICALYKGE